MALLRRGKKFYFVKRFPKEFADVDGRKIIQISLKTDSEDEALGRIPAIEASLHEYWGRCVRVLAMPMGTRRLSLLLRALGYRNETSFTCFALNSERCEQRRQKKKSSEPQTLPVPKAETDQAADVQHTRRSRAAHQQRHAVASWL
jgi:hypothetical protein